MLINRIKLAKALLKLAALITDKEELIYEGELMVGTEVFVEREGEIFPAEDGEYVAEGRTIVVSEGRVSEIREAETVEEVQIEVEEAEEQPQETQPQEDARIKELEAQLAEKDAVIAEMEAEISVKEKEIAEKDARIAELEVDVNNKEEELKSLKMSTELPAKEQVKKETKTGALKYFN